MNEPQAVKKPAICCTELRTFYCGSNESPKGGIGGHAHIGCLHQEYVSKDWVFSYCIGRYRSCGLRKTIGKKIRKKEE